MLVWTLFINGDRATTFSISAITFVGPLISSSDWVWSNVADENILGFTTLESPLL